METEFQTKNRLAREKKWKDISIDHSMPAVFVTRPNANGVREVLVAIPDIKEVIGTYGHVWYKNGIRGWWECTGSDLRFNYIEDALEFVLHNDLVVIYE